MNKTLPPTRHMMVLIMLTGFASSHAISANTTPTTNTPFSITQDMADIVFNTPITDTENKIQLAQKSPTSNAAQASANKKTKKPPVAHKTAPQNTQSTKHLDYLINKQIQDTQRRLNQRRRLQARVRQNPSLSSASDKKALAKYQIGRQPAKHQAASTAQQRAALKKHQERQHQHQQRQLADARKKAIIIKNQQKKRQQQALNEKKRRLALAKQPQSSNPKAIQQLAQKKRLLQQKKQQQHALNEQKRRLALAKQQQKTLNEQKRRLALAKQQQHTLLKQKQALKQTLVKQKKQAQPTKTPAGKGTPIWQNTQFINKIRQ